MRAAVAALLLLAAPSAFAADKYASKLGTIDCGNEHLYVAGETCPKPTPCKTNAECKDASGVIGGLPYICLSDISYCGWQDLSKKKPEGK